MDALLRAARGTPAVLKLSSLSCLTALLNVIAQKPEVLHTLSRCSEHCTNFSFTFVLCQPDKVKISCVSLVHCKHWLSEELEVFNYCDSMRPLYPIDCR